MSACRKPSIAFGTSFVNNNNTSIIVVDTSTVLLSTVLEDSFPTAGTGTMLLGRYQDPELGMITSKTFLQIGTPGVKSVSALAGFDSISLIMHINKTFYGDTTITQRYYVSQLQQVIQFPYPTQTTYYNKSGFAFNPAPLGYTDVNISPTAVHTTQNALDTVKIRLADTLGQKLLSMIQNKSDTISNSNSFLGYFKGLVIYSDTSVSHIGTMYGFKDTVIMRLYYHEPGVFTTSKYIDFPYSNRANQFNQIAVNRKGTPVAVLDSLQSVRTNRLIPTEAPSSLTNHAVYVQGITGLQTKMRFPYISNILGVPDYVSVLKAQLILRPVVGTFSPELSLPPQLILNTTDLTNQPGSIIFANGSIEYGSLNVDYLYGQSTSYAYDITSYIQQQLNLVNILNNGLILSVPSPAKSTSANRAVFGDIVNKNYTITLKIYYISLIH
ncbi:MAG TPA: DUF4270 family protein [Puia sp.]|nr:DUF4270 family protein [Puia sp.]